MGWLTDDIFEKDVIVEMVPARVKSVICKISNQVSENKMLKRFPKTNIEKKQKRSTSKNFKNVTLEKNLYISIDNIIIWIILKIYQKTKKI